MLPLRLVASLVISGLALLLLGIALSFTPARAATGPAPRDYDTSAYRYTDKPAPASVSAGIRTLAVYVDRDFGPAERERIGPQGEFIWTPANNRFGWRALLGTEPGGTDISPYAALSLAEA